MIDKLTPELQALIPVYRDKWRKIALSTERIDREKVVEALNDAYTLIGLNEPKIIFCDSPYAALNHPYHQIREQLCKELWVDIHTQINNQVDAKLLIKLLNQTNSQLESQLNLIAWQLDRQLDKEFDTELVLNCLKPESLAYYGSTFDFCIYVLHCNHNQREWFIYQSLAKFCGWIFFYKKTCIVCDRPISLHFNNQNRLHGEGKPAIEFADGYSLYSYHGVTLPEKYGKIHPHAWESQWLLSEDNAELRRVLIQGIGYDRIARELQAIELDAWAEYTLLKIDADVDQQPIHLLKMTCPSTGFIHALRVPPDTESARSAIRWINWGIDPEEFHYSNVILSE